ncbi:hypothetical protein G9A89_010699 [Geosiphon pyriformis]|nr:hypothetical protein G9A89_010699 [Geosiphon pyriformis]
MAGAGISTAAGIPDFRSAGTGLYDNLQRYNLPYPEAIFDINYFKQHPEPFFELAKELYPGKFLPTLTHYFIKLLHNHKLLLRCFTQNIDTLERASGLLDDILVEAHGSFAKSQCVKCKDVADEQWMKVEVLRGVIPKCPKCSSGIVKPCITFFGESLPPKFFKHLSDFEDCDLLIVLGTSLQVQPFASLIEKVGDKTLRLLINREPVGVYGPSQRGFDFEGKYHKYQRDVFLAGTCDDGVRKLAALCGWENELEELRASGHKSLKQQYELLAEEPIIKPSTEVPDKNQKAAEVDELAKLLEKKAVISENDQISQETTPGPANKIRENLVDDQKDQSLSDLSHGSDEKAVTEPHRSIEVKKTPSQPSLLPESQDESKIIVNSIIEVKDDTTSKEETFSKAKPI